MRFTSLEERAAASSPNVGAAMRAGASRRQQINIGYKSLYYELFEAVGGGVPGGSRKIVERFGPLRRTTTCRAHGANRRDRAGRVLQSRAPLLPLASSCAQMPHSSHGSDLPIRPMSAKETTP